MTATAPETPDDQPQKEPGAAVARRTPTDQWLAGQTGVKVEDTEGGRMISLSTELAERVNLLVPISQVVQLSPNWTPVPRIVTLVAGKDTYKQGYADGEDQHALRATGLRKIADLMGIQHVGTNWGNAPDTPNSIKATVTAKMRGPDGLWIHTTKSKTIRIADHREKLILDAEGKWLEDKPIWEEAKAKKDKNPDVRLQGKEYPVWIKYGPGGFDERYQRGLILADGEHLDQKCETKAWNRCIRELAKVGAIRASDLAKPFLTIGYFMTPDMSDPHIQEFVRLQYETSENAMFGAGAAAGAAVAEISAAEAAHALPEGSFIADGEYVDDDEDDDLDDEPPPDAEIAGEEVPLPGMEGTAPAADTAIAEDDWGGEDGRTEEGDEEPFPMPEKGMKIPSGEFAGQEIEEVVKTPAGRAYLAGNVKRLRNAGNREVVLAWLSFAAEQEVTLENVSAVFS